MKINSVPANRRTVLRPFRYQFCVAKCVWWIKSVVGAATGSLPGHNWMIRGSRRRVGEVVP
jgi:hypothetical protein